MEEIKKEEIAERFVEAIKRISNKEENLNNLKFYLTRHFEEWLTKFAKTPLDLMVEMECFADMEI